MVKTFGAFAVEMLHFLEIVMPACESRMALRTMRLSVPINLTPVIPRSTPRALASRREATWESVSF